MSNLNIREILKGMEPKQMQTVGIMQVIPLTMDESLWDENFTSPNEVEFSNNAYGSMTFKNPTDKPVILPSHIGYVVPGKSAQDHAMATAGLVAAKKSKTYKNAMCIQESQGGTYQSGNYELLILPYSLREAALTKRKQQSYDKLWGDIRQFNNTLAVSSGRGGHLEYFLSHYKGELDQFVAEFECVPKQCGAIILVDGELVGVERSPSPKYWRSIWSTLIRECYGSLAILARKKYGDKLPALKTRVPMKVRGVNTLDDLENAFNEAKEKEDEKVKTIIRKMLDDEFEDDVEEAVGERKMVTVKNDQFMGQVLRSGRKIVYASLFTTQDWSKNHDWNEAEAFSI
jgi:hypothetical protein